MRIKCVDSNLVMIELGITILDIYEKICNENKLDLNGFSTSGSRGGGRPGARPPYFSATDNFVLSILTILF